MQLSIIIPVFNESGTLCEFCSRLLAVLKSESLSYEIIFVDDGSTDGTAEIILSFIKENPEIKLISFVKNFGQHNALYAGFSHATGDLILTMDGDMQYIPEDISILLAEVDDNTDIISGCRRKRSDPVYRSFSSVVFNKIMNRFLNTQIMDYGSMFRIHKKHVIDCILKCNESFLYTTALVSWLGFSVKEVTVSCNARQYGYSKYSFFSLLRLFLNIIVRYSKEVFQFFAVSASVFLIMALSVFSWMFFYSSQISSAVFLMGLFLFCALFIGVINLFLIGQYLVRIYSDIQFNPRYIIRKTHGFN